MPPSTSYPPIVAQRFFAQRALELLHSQTIDSYRLRVLNPVLSIIEVKDIYEGVMQGRIKNEETLLSSIKECISLLKRDKILKFASIDKDFILKEVLQKINKENCRSHFIDVCHVVNTLFRENEHYCQNLLSALRDILFKPLSGDPFLKLQEIDDLLGSMVTDLVRLGFSKSYLFKFFRSAFFSKDKFEVKRFEGGFLLLEDLPKWKKREHKIWFFVGSPNLTEGDWEKFSQWECRSDLTDIPPATPFGKPKGGHIYLGIKRLALDYFSALMEAKQALSELFDIAKLAYHKEKISLIDIALVIDLVNPGGARLHRVAYISDGKFPTGQEVLAKLRERLPIVLEKQKIATETKEKIKSALRYLRYGNESYELEHQFVNYWIGLEYLFSNEKEGAFSRIKAIFPILQVLIYLQRNLSDFHQSLAGLPVIDWEHFDKEEPRCLLKEEVLVEIRDHIFEDYPLRAYRAWQMRLRLNHDSKRSEYLQNHIEHLEWHLTRIYRVRNEIVHEAKHSFQNQTLSSNLRYYLAFALSVVLDHFSRENNETNDLDAYFSLQHFKHKHLAHEKFPQDKMLDLQYDFEMLS